MVVCVGGVNGPWLHLACEMLQLPESLIEEMSVPPPRTACPGHRLVWDVGDGGDPDADQREGADLGGVVCSVERGQCTHDCKRRRVPARASACV